MPIGLADVITGVVMLGIVLGIGIPVIRLRGFPTFAPTAEVEAAAAAAARRREVRLTPVRLHPIWLTLVPLGLVVATVGLFLPAFSVPAAFQGGTLVHNSVIDHIALIPMLAAVVGVIAFLTEVALPAAAHHRPHPRAIGAPVVLLIAAATFLLGATEESVLNHQIHAHADAGLGPYIMILGLLVAILGVCGLLLAPAPTRQDSGSS